MQTPNTDKKQSVKGRVASFWNDTPCESIFANQSTDQPSFFKQIEQFRYSNQPYMEQLVGFNRFQNKRLLEVGCGLGTDLRQFALGGASVVGVDLSANSVNLAKTGFDCLGVEGQFVNADSESLPFNNAAFDAVYSFGVLHHTPDTQKAIDECWRVLKPGGQFIVMLYNRRSWHVIVEPYLLVLKHWLSRRPLPSNPTRSSEVVRRYDGNDNPLGKAYSPNEVRGLLRHYQDVDITICQSRFWGNSKLVRIYGQFLRWCGIERKWGFWIVAQGKRPNILNGVG